MRAVRLPYLQCSQGGTLGPWELYLEGGPVPLPEVHPAWDSGVDVRVSRTLSFDGERFQREAGLGRGANVRLVAGFECEHARSRSFPWRRSVGLPSSFNGEVEFVAPAARIAARLDLVVGAVLINPGSGAAAAAAKTPGSWLWIERTQFVLEGSTSRFPMEWTAFRSSGLPRNAAWFLDWPAQDWTAPALGSLRLLLNSDNAVVRKVVDLPEKDTRRKIVIQAAMLDVAKQLIVAALNSEDFLAEADEFVEGSVGFSVRLLLSVAFPHDEPKAVRDRLIHQAGEFHVQLQDGLGSFDVALDE